jgi:hypothetical protein
MTIFSMRSAGVSPGGISLGSISLGSITERNFRQDNP